LSTESADLHYEDTIKYLRKFLENGSIKTDMKMKKAIRRKLSRSYYSLGRFYFKDSNGAQARRCILLFLKSIEYDHFFLKAYLFLFIAFVMVQWYKIRTRKGS